MEDKERELIFEVAGMAGDILLRSGAEISRVDETMRRIACAYELENTLCRRLVSLAASTCAECSSYYKCHYAQKNLVCSFFHNFLPLNK